VVGRLRELAAQNPDRVQHVHLVELQELAALLGPASRAAILLEVAENLTNPQLYRVGLSRQWLVLLDAAPGDTVVLRRWW
jgi:hypothetical protein